MGTVCSQVADPQVVENISFHGQARSPPNRLEKRPASNFDSKCKFHLSI